MLNSLVMISPHRILLPQMEVLEPSRKRHIAEPEVFARLASKPREKPLPLGVVDVNAAARDGPERRAG